MPMARFDRMSPERLAELVDRFSVLKIAAGVAAHHPKSTKGEGALSDFIRRRFTSAFGMHVGVGV